MSDNPAPINAKKYKNLRKIRLNLLLEERRMFGNLNSVVIFQILSIEYWSRQIENAEKQGLIVPDVSERNPAYTHEIGLSAQSITDISQMPRTTVLRSLERLEKLGFVLKTDVGYYINEVKTRTDCKHLYTSWYASTLNLMK